MEIDTYTLVGREPVLLKFNSEQYGILASNFEIGENLAVTHGVALKNLGPAKFRSANQDFKFWYSFRASPIGQIANKEKLTDETITLWANKNHKLVCHSLVDIVSEYSHRHNFKRSKRPFVALGEHGSACWGVLWEVYPALRRLGVYIGRNDKGLGGYVHFYDFDEFKVL